MNQNEILEALRAKKLTPQEAKDLLESSTFAATEVVQKSKNVATLPTERIAIIGMAGKYPDAQDLYEFWNNLAMARNSIREIPPSRWNVGSYFDPRPQQPTKTHCKWLGIVDDVECFDPLFFNISPAEAGAMDPQHRLFIQEAYHAFEDGGYNPAAMSEKRCGVYLGIMGNEYASLISKSAKSYGDATGNSASIGAARIAYHLNLKGPAIAIDTACSSSLVATHLACQALLTREIDMAVAGGVTLYLTPEPLINMSNAGMLSVDGRCKTFDNRANGFVPGEGIGVVLLKRLSDALADGDRIRAVILGSGINQDGKTNGITAPNLRSQAELIQEVYTKSGVDPESVSYIEAHGTGTKLGDPVELEALSTAFRMRTHQRQFCAIGSVKSNIGHTSAAAGMAGLHKVVLAIENEKLVPSLHFETPNEHFDFECSPFFVNTSLRDWSVAAGSPRRAGISSFGYSGTNAHMIIEEYVSNQEITGECIQGKSNGGELIVLSAQSEAQLRTYAQKIVQHLEAHQKIELSDIAFTLQVAREAMECRFALVVASREELLDQLKQFSKSGKAQDAVTGSAKENYETLAALCDEDGREFVRTLYAKKKLATLAKLWAKGLDIDWNAVPRDGGQRKIGLPCYPFAREWCWLENTALATAPQNVVQVSVPPDADNNEYVELLLPEWNSVSVEEDVDTPYRTQRLTIIGGDEEQHGFFRERHSDVHILTPTNHETSDALERKLDELGPVHHIVWIAPQSGPGSILNDRLLDIQRAAVLSCFRTIKALLRLGYGTRNLEWTVITTCAASVKEDESTDPGHAGLQGLIGSMAQEYPHWVVKIIDVADNKECYADLVLSAPAHSHGSAWFRRNSIWYQRQLTKIEKPSAVRAPYREGGVYVVIGGAGGVGEVWSEHMIRAYRARIIWIGRRRLDSVIEQKLQRLAMIGEAPIYISADATDRVALEQACQLVKSQFNAIHGVVHAAIDLFDRAIENMDEEHFLRGFSAKSDVCVRIAQVFHCEALDFFLFFSSMESFAPGAGKSNYAAGCMFEDAFAHQLARDCGCPVKVINWGHWGDIGVAKLVPSVYKDQWVKAGIGAISPIEGMDALDALFASSFSRLALTKKILSPRKVVPKVTVTEKSVRDTIRRQLSTILHIDAARIDDDSPFYDYGVDSINSIRIAKGINDALGAELPATTLLEYDSVNKLVRHAVEMYRGADIGLSSAEIYAKGSSRLKTIPETNPEEYVRETVRQQLSAMLCLDATRIDDDSPFYDYGVDSINSIRIAKAINDALETDLPATTLLEYDSVKKLVTHIGKWYQNAFQKTLAYEEGFI